MRENSIEWLNGDDTMTVSLSQRRLISRVKKMAAKYPDMAEIVAENEDGSIMAHVSIKALHLTIYGRKNGEVSDGFDGETEEDGGEYEE